MSDETLIEIALEETRDKMARAIEHIKNEFATVRTGRATPQLVDRLKVEYFGSDVPLQQLAGVTVSEARVLVINPYDKGALKAIEKAIISSDLGVNPSNDGAVIRLSFPPLTEERRKELVKVVRQRAEDGRVALRNVRRQTRHELESLEKDSDISSDDLEWAEKELDVITQHVVAEVDRLYSAIKSRSSSRFDREPDGARRSHRRRRSGGGRSEPSTPSTRARDLRRPHSDRDASHRRDCRG